jgi:large subunit ribosomal protein L14e
MTFTRFVEVGRVVLINYGPDRGKLATIVDICDAKRVLVDGPQKETGVHRQLVLLKRCALTDVVVKDLAKNASQKALSAAWAAQGVKAQWAKSAWAKKIDNKAKRASLSDFGRFKVMVAKKQRSKAVADALAK